MHYFLDAHVSNADGKVTVLLIFLCDYGNIMWVFFHICKPDQNLLNFNLELYEHKKQWKIQMALHVFSQILENFLVL